MNRNISAIITIIKSKKKIMIVSIVILLGIIFSVFYFNSHTPESEPQITVDEITDTETTKDESSSIYVDIAGAVKSPSVIILAEGSRVFEAIEAAGGLTEDADIKEINRAEVLEDGTYLYIPTNKESEEQSEEKAQGILNGSQSSSSSPGLSQGKININTADSTVLQQLNGVGPATAEKIISHRESVGKFKKIEDLKNVSGIGDKTYEKLAAFIKV